MVVSKRCKICTVLDADNIPISGEYFGKLLPELIAKISGVDLDPRKANGVLICQSCALQLVHIGSVVDKLRNSLQRLKKLETKSKISAKVSAASKSTDNKDSVGEEGGEIDAHINLNESKAEDKIKPKTPKKVVRRKSVFPDDNLINNGEHKSSDENNDTEANGNDLQSKTGDAKPTNTTKSNTPKKIKPEEAIETPENKQNSKSPKKIVRRKSVFPDNSKLNGEENKTATSENDSQTNLENSKSPSKILTKTPKKVVRRKSIIPEDKQVRSELTNLEDSGLDEISSQSNLNESKTKKQEKFKTPKKPSVETQSTPGANSKFKKILDDENVKTPVKSTPTKPAKRKVAASNDESLKTSENILSPTKRAKTESISFNDESPIDSTIDEHDGNVSYNDTSVAENKVKVLNCIICGKAFHQKSALRDHIETSHMGERLKSCPHCSSEFRSQQKYESHVFSEKCKNTNHACQYPKCNKRFKTVHKMEMHMHEKHSSQNEYEDE